MTRKYCITVEHSLFWTVGVFCTINRTGWKRQQWFFALFAPNKQRWANCGANYQVTGKLVPQQYVQFLFGEGEIQRTSNMWTKRTSPHQYLSPVTGGMRDKGEFIIKTDSIFHHLAVKNSASGAWLEIQALRLLRAMFRGRSFQSEHSGGLWLWCFKFF